jgi:hypothetical protein
MLIRANPWGPGLQNAPVVPTISPIFDMDSGNNGLDALGASFMNWRDSWTIIDSIGIHGEASETRFGRLYGQVNFGSRPGFLPVNWVPLTEPGTEFQLLNYEIEYIGRWGNSTGQTLNDWHISNLTDNAGSGSAGVLAPGGPDWRQSCLGNACHPEPDEFPTTPAPERETESNMSVPYGTKLTTTLGAPNYITGDFNKDGYVDVADFVVWVKTQGQLGIETNHPFADANHDFQVTATDNNSWAKFFGQPNFAGGGGGFSARDESGVPEPGNLLIAGAGIFGFLPNFSRRTRRSCQSR